MENENPCPVSAPKLIKAKSLVETCASCGAWAERYPEFFGEADNYCWQCEKCSNTSVKIREGRSYGAKSREWENIVKQFNELFLDITPDYWDSVETEPPMKDLDWQAIEAWYRSQGIYRIFIHVGNVSKIDNEAQL